MRLEVFIDAEHVGELEHDPASNRFAFRYADAWLRLPGRFALSPHLPLQAVEEPPDTHSARVRAFFENLLPEGEALDDAARAHGLSRASVAGLLAVLGRETAGSLRIVAEGAVETGAVQRRALPLEEVSRRIRERPAVPFSVWDGKVRLSIAGHQDKLAVYEEEGHWFLVEGRTLASTHILKPPSLREAFPGLVFNEFACMRLAHLAGLPVAEVDIAHVPEAVLVVRRFDRAVQGGGVRRLNVIDGCQALGLAVALKYERPYGDAEAVRHLRDGASLPRLFALANTLTHPAAQRLALLRWTLFQALVGNTDAHAKNLSFFCGPHGLHLAPAYDIACTLAYAGHGGLDDSFAMAIGDAFTPQELLPYEWAHFAHLCGLSPRLVARELKQLALKVRAVLDIALAQARALGAPAQVLEAIRHVVEGQCTRHAGFADEIPKVDRGLF